MNTFLVFFLSLISWILFHLPRSFVRWLGSLLGVLWFDILRFRRKVIRQNLEIAFPEWTESQKIKVGRNSVYQLGSNFAEFFTLPYLNSAWIKKHAAYEGLPHLQEAVNKNRGVYLLSMHIGHGDMGASLISLAGFKVYLITKFFKNKLFNDIWFHFRSGQGVRFIEPHGPRTPFEILKAIREKACVVFVLDQFMGKPYGVETSFFGRKTGTAYGLALFYLKTRSPVVPVYTFEGADARVHLAFEPELDLEAYVDEDKEKSIERLTQYFTDQIEKIVRRYPEQWMWVHRRWKVIE